MLHRSPNTTPRATQPVQAMSDTRSITELLEKLSKNAIDLLQVMSSQRHISQNMRTLTNEMISIIREAKTLDSVSNTNTKENDKDSEKACTRTSPFIRRDTKAKRALNMADKPPPKL